MQNSPLRLQPNPKLLMNFYAKLCWLLTTFSHAGFGLQHFTEIRLSGHKLKTPQASEIAHHRERGDTHTIHKSSGFT